MRRSQILCTVVVACVVLLMHPDPAHARSVECPCPCPCSRENKPVCAKRGTQIREFSNECLWENHNCQNGADAYPEVTEGECH